MKIFIGEEGLERSWQDKFEKTTTCVHCKGEARIGFVGFEDGEDSEPPICNLHENEKGDMWLHDYMACAIYWCRECLDTTAIYNQA